MTVLRDPERATRETFDAIVVGGGVYGAMLLLEATRCGLRAVCVERDDFGGATSWNYLRILHGGLRYLQRIDLPRHRESIGEVRRFLCEFGDFVRPLPCWMPLDWTGLHNPLVLRAAAGVDRWLSLGRNRGVAPERKLAPGRVWSGTDLARHTRDWGISRSPAALRWFDAFVPRPRRLMMEILHRACDAGAVALNRAEALDPIVGRDGVEGLRVRDRIGGSEFELRAPLLFDATGPEAGGLARRWQRGGPAPQVATVAWNVLLDVQPRFAEALAVAAPQPAAPVLFLIPWEGRLLAGTGHAPATGGGAPAVPPVALARFLSDLAAALPELGICEDRVLRVYSGFLPGVRAGSARLSHRPLIIDHARRGGPRGLWSVSGVKFTTARRVAERTLRRATGRGPLVADPTAAGERCVSRLERLRFGPDWRPESDPEGCAILRSMIADESALHLEDLLLRRTSLGDDPRSARAVAPSIARWFAADAALQDAECARLMRALDSARAPLR